MAGFNGNTDIQAVELRMITAGENFVGGGAIRTYDAVGAPIATLGTFPGSVTNGIADRKILCATALFQSTFGITADLTISPGVIPTTGQVSFEIPGCFVNAIPYGDVTVFKNGTTAAPQLPTGLAYVLVRTVANGTVPSCPLAENAAARFQLRSASMASPIPFSNNANVTVNVFSTLTAAEALAAPPSPLRAAPNPFRHATGIEISGVGGRVLLHDVQGRLIRSWDGSRGTQMAEGGRSLRWDGTDAHGRAVASGIYFVRTTGAGSAAVRPLRIVLLR